jgi:hypothetical protein
VDINSNANQFFYFKYIYIRAIAQANGPIVKFAAPINWAGGGGDGPIIIPAPIIRIAAAEK